MSAAAVAKTPAPVPVLWPWSLFAAMIAAAGLPIYIHAPKFYVDSYGVNLATLGGVLALLRLIDVVQDPLFGWLAEVTRARRATWVIWSVGVLIVSMVGLFAIVPPIAPLLWFAITLTGLFSAFSFLTIVFYAQGVELAAQLGGRGHLRLAGWRETGSLIGVSLAAVAPVVLGAAFEAPFVGFAVGFALLALTATFAMHRAWRGGYTISAQTPASVFAVFRPALADPTARRLLLLALINAAPVAVTSTLFLFFVESRLGLPDAAGAYLLVFFLSAAITAPMWSKAGQVYGEKQILLAGMALAIVSFLWAYGLGTGQWLAFGLISAASGAALGADMVLLPAIFARRLADLGNEGAGFGLWSFVSKLSLALAAATLLPALQWAGFTSGGENSPAVLGVLSLLYAAVPCALKAIALLLLTFIPFEKA